MLEIAILVAAVTALGITIAVLRRNRAGDMEPPGEQEASVRGRPASRA
ncbi:MAG: hypothetical protein M3198_13955 [Actinomycetota bacterium]|nr:hypothetical protein [Actinomycetota bacterium]